VTTLIQTEFDLPGTAAAAYALLCDQAFALERVAVAGARSPQLLRHEVAADGALTMGMKTVTARQDLPRAIRAFVRGEPGAERTEVWRQEGEDYAADVVIVLEGAPSVIGGTVALRSSAGASRLVVHVSVQIPLPMFGKDVEAVVVSNVRKSLQAEADLFAAHLTGASGVEPVAAAPVTKGIAPEQAAPHTAADAAVHETPGLRRVFEGLAWGEGLRWHDDQLWVSDTRTATLWHGQGDTWTSHALESPTNGLWFLPDGRLVAALMEEARIGVWDGAGFQTYADLSPLAPGPLGDLVGDAHGNLYVDDVAYSLPKGEAHKPGRLLRVTPDGEVSVAAEGLEFPNGLAFLDHGRTLAVAETMAQRLSLFDVEQDGTLDRRGEIDLSAPGEFVGPDGLWTDGQNLWVATLSANRCSASGTVSSTACSTPRACAPSRGAPARTGGCT
jgi:sugar lactone lactonase YvrE